ncbi:uncharacterized protein LOC117103311 [Anneissia japonica]|uniref:uncharacterized protein LOC117103311 n=1 Tax=Anneissia japonica TaxID=1529436 RepID=UPI001425A359|nr:uncharacterized protein LOC117103311 [Anneissia japonica]
MQSRHKRLQIYKELFGYIKPVGVTLGHKNIRTKGKIKRVNRVGYFIPFLQSLQGFLNLPEVQKFVVNPHQSTDNMMYDICDGIAIQNHPIFQRNPQALQIVLNCDDIEIVNPIGVHVKKHKLSMFYWVLGNLPPEYRSRLTSIHLLAVAKTQDLKQDNMGCKKLLQDFLAGIRCLKNDGIQININGRQQTIEGFLAIFPCDTPAAQWLGGFKEGVGFALKPCRTCNISKEDMKMHLDETEISLRDELVHKERCGEMENLSSAALKYWSKMWGINGRSCLFDIDFPLCSALVHDPMHVFLEGLVPLELKLMLYQFIYVDRFFTLEWLNGKLSNFSYTYLETDTKVVALDYTHFHGEQRIKQTAASIHTLSLILPFIVGPCIPNGNKKWLNFLCLVKNMLLCVSPYADRNTVGQLQQMIYTHHSVYIEEYPRASFTPKMHYCVHMPSQILKYGPARYHWCMRFEAKHTHTKSKKWKNFKNLPLSVAIKHQMVMCHSQASNINNCLYEGDEVNEGAEVLPHENFPQLIEKLCDATNSNAFRDPATIVFVTDSVKIHGHKFRPGCCLRLNYDENEVPIFGKLTEIIVFNQEKLFVVDVMSVDHFEEQGLCYILVDSGKQAVVTYHSLSSKWPLNFHLYNKQCAVINQYSHI